MKWEGNPEINLLVIPAVEQLSNEGVMSDSERGEKRGLGLGVCVCVCEGRGALNVSGDRGVSSLFPSFPPPFTFHLCICLLLFNCCCHGSACTMLEGVEGLCITGENLKKNKKKVLMCVCMGWWV